MKKGVKRKRLWGTLKIADIYSDKHSVGSGRCPKNLQGTCPLTHFGRCPNPSSPEGRKRAQLPPFLLGQDNP